MCMLGFVVMYPAVWYMYVGLCYRMAIVWYVGLCGCTLCTNKKFTFRSRSTIVVCSVRSWINDLPVFMFDCVMFHFDKPGNNSNTLYRQYSPSAVSSRAYSNGTNTAIEFYTRTQESTHRYLQTVQDMAVLAGSINRICATPHFIPTVVVQKQLLRSGNEMVVHTQLSVDTVEAHQFRCLAQSIVPVPACTTSATHLFRFRIHMHHCCVHLEMNHKHTSCATIIQREWKVNFHWWLLYLYGHQFCALWTYVYNCRQCRTVGLLD